MEPKLLRKSIMPLVIISLGTGKLDTVPLDILTAVDSNKIRCMVDLKE